MLIPNACLTSLKTALELIEFDSNLNIMKNIILSLFVVTFLLSPVLSGTAQALSCLPIDMYLKDVVGKDDIVIFTATSQDRMDETGYTSEVLRVEEVKQGYVESEIFVYHENSQDWGYLCNQGPKAKGSKGLYVASRDHLGKYNVYQRLEMSDPLVTALEKDLEAAEVTGEIAELPSIDRMNQIITTLTDLFKEVGKLLKEYAYWKNNN